MAEETRKSNAHAGHRGRMRTRFQAAGFDNFQPHEVLEMLLFEFIRVANTNPIGHELVEHFGTVWNVLTAPPEELEKVNGIGPKTAEGIAQIYSLYTAHILECFRTSGALTRYDIAFLADWFMDGVPAGSMGILICDYDHCLQDFVRLEVSAEITVFDLAEQIVRAAAGRAYYLLIKEDYSLLPKETAQMLRQITGRGQAYLTDAFVLEGYTPVSVFYS